MGTILDTMGTILDTMGTILVELKSHTRTQSRTRGPI